MFSDKDINQIKSHGLTEADVLKQLNIFKKGIPFAKIIATASKDKGIQSFSEDEQEEFVALFDNKKDTLQLVKFVPASGAASRMFKFLHQFLEVYNSELELEDFLEKEENTNLKTFFASIEKFPFYELVLDKLSEKNSNYNKLEKAEQLFLFLKEMLSENGFNYTHTPKGLVPFHKYDYTIVTAFGEQLYEAAFYSTSNKISNLHFTVSEEHEAKFKERFDGIRNTIEEKTDVKFNITYSFQKKETDTIAVTLENEVFVDDSNNLVFRPSGHGALLQNLNEIDADIIFIKNIDNVVSENYVEEIAFQKKVLAGKLLSIQQQIFEFIEEIQNKNVTEYSESFLRKATNFIEAELNIKVAKTRESIETIESKGSKISKEQILKILNRPIRICGMVENTGAPGGGPFLVEAENGNQSYQIVEMSQIDMKNKQQKDLAKSATHFNPVDLVCGVRNYKGEKFDLMKFQDVDAGFISEKSFQGKPIKALELPGLWNGAMANWITIFVEVPQITFTPVKTVNDLLNQAHQPK